MNTLVPFTVYDAGTGEIKRTGYCPENSYQFQVGAGEAILPQAVDNASRFHVVDGYIVPLDK